MRRKVSTSVAHLVSVLRDQVVIPELAEERVRLLHARHFGFMTAEKPQEFVVLQPVHRVHVWFHSAETFVLGGR